PPWPVASPGSQRQSNPPQQPPSPTPTPTPTSTSTPATAPPRHNETCSPPRNPSTSPPPLPPRTPPRETFMSLADDGYRMVEDELLRTAHLFTIHLHRAEYNRQKTHAKAQHAATILEMERPVVGDPPASARLRAAMRSRDARQRAVLQEGGDLEPLPALRVAGLRRLMDCPRGEDRSIPTSLRTPPVLSNTRAAAGFRRPFVGAHTEPRRRRRSSTSSGSGGGGTAPSRLDPSPPSSGPAPLTEKTCYNGRPDPPAANERATRQQDDGRKKHGTSETYGPDLSDDDDDDDDDDPFSSFKRRRLLRQRARDQQCKPRETGPRPKALPDTIPSFL
ncbi:hypothetical protein L249_3704, partial [Ophiocordyceps polyrhachis-furcata BCC 54312]